jgi:hypothetical protein
VSAYGVAIVPSTSMIRNPQLRALPIIHHGISIGQWSTICWDPQRLLQPYAGQFVDELVSHARRSFRAASIFDTPHPCLSQASRPTERMMWGAGSCSAAPADKAHRPRVGVLPSGGMSGHGRFCCKSRI